MGRIGRGAVAALILGLAGCVAGQPTRLAGSSWELVELREAGQVVRVEDPARYTMAFDLGDAVALRLDCNRGAGQAVVTPLLRGGRIEFGQIAMTRAMCPPGSLDTRVARTVSEAQLYTLQAGTLQLDAPGGRQLLWRRAAAAPPG